jgi:F-type H+-transporting ATPase subunit delta
MRGVSRSSLVAAHERLDAVLPSVDAGSLGEELFAVLHVLDREHGLRRAVSDPSRDPEQKAQLVRVLFEGKVSSDTLDLVADVVRLGWARPGDLATALERLAASATVGQLTDATGLDDLDDDMFRFTRLVAAEPELRAALSNPALPAERKRDLLDALLAERVHPATLRLVTEVAVHPRGRGLDRGLDEYARIAAERRRRLIAVVRTAVALSGSQKSRLAAALSAQYGREIHINIELDPDIVGGMTVRVGDEEIDGSIAGRLADVRRQLGAES